MQVVVISDSEKVSQTVQQVLFREGHDCPSTNLAPLSAAVERITHSTPPDLGIVVLTPNADQGLAAVGELRQVSPVRLLVIGPANDPRLVLQSLRLGASDYLDEAQIEADLTAALGRLQNELGPRAEPGSIIAFLGPSGGCGSSTLAANVATCLAQKHSKALLMDMKLESGDLAALLDLRPSHSLADICQNMTRMDRTMFERCLAPHSSGLKLLASPANFRQVADVTTDGVRQALTLARSLFPYVVLDLDHTFREEQLLALKMADTILLVFRLDFASLRNTNRVLEYLGRLEIRPQKVRLVVNRFGQAQEVPVAKAEEALGMKIFHFVPEDPKSVNRANNNGVPVVLDYPSAKVAKSLSALAISVNGRARD